MSRTFAKLTRPAIRQLAAGDKLNEHGIMFERKADGDGVYSVGLMVDGERIHRVIGRESDGTTRTQAEEYIDKVRQDAKAGRLNLPKGRKLALTFREAASQYLDKLTLEDGKDITMKRRRLRLHLTPFFGDQQLAKIVTFDVERYKKQRGSELGLRPNGLGGKPSNGGKIKPSTINREVAVLSHIFTKAIEWGWIDHRPATIKRLKEDSGRITYLTVEQIKSLLKIAAGDQSIQLYPFMRIGFDTSMRQMEILSIRLEHLNLEQLVIYIPIAKTGAREQPMTAKLGEYLTTYVATLQPGEQWLFPSPDAKDGHTVNINKPFRRCVAAAGLNIKQVVRHTMRHTAVTHLVQAGVDLPTVQRISGHKSLVTLLKYAHQNGAHIQEAMNKLSTRYDEKAKPRAKAA
jgi:integrase